MSGSPRLTNDLMELRPRTTFAGPVLEFDFPAFSIGVAEYPEGPTGCTVFLFPDLVSVAMDVRGGSPGFLLEAGITHAICLAGGSIHGLEAAIGVNAELFARRGYATRWDQLSLVLGAVIYDFGPRDNAIYPDKALGRAAVQAARPGIFPIGPVGAGASATVGNGPRFDQGEPAGQGAAFRQFGPTKIAVFTVVNAIGAVVHRAGNVVRGHLDSETGLRYPAAENVERIVGRGEAPERPDGIGQNTTLTVLITNQRLDRGTLTQWGRQVHSSMARAIQPFHTIEDGDILYAVTTDEVDNPGLDPASLGVVASELAWDAVLAAVSQPGRPQRGER